MINKHKSIINKHKSINNKVNDLSKKLSKLRHVDFGSDTFEAVLINSVKDKQEKARTKKLESVRDNYTVGLLSQTNIHPDNIFEIIMYSVKWIEVNVQHLCDALNILKDSDFKSNACLCLIREVMPDVFSNEFIKKGY